MIAGEPESRRRELAPVAGARLTEVAPGWAGNTVNVVSFRHSSIVSRGGRQYLAWYDQSGLIMLGRRSLGGTEWEIRPTRHRGNVADAHNAICLAVDGTGVLHVAWGDHNRSLRYARSRSADSMDLTETLAMTGRSETRVTYPEFYAMPDGGLLFMYRSGESGRGDLVLNRLDVKSISWIQVHQNLIDGEGRRSAYWQAAVGSDGAVHLSWVWRDTADVATNHGLCYARSPDGGTTWERTDGAQLSVPMTIRSGEWAVAIPQRHELINQTSMAIDSAGRPHIATYWRDEGTDIPQYRLIWHDGSRWRVSAIGGQTVAFRLAGAGTKRIPISRPRIFVDRSGPTDKVYLLHRDQARGDEVSVAICDDLSKQQWRFEDLTRGGVGQWEPSYDVQLWQERRILHAFVQRANQEDGEGVNEVPPEMVYVLEWQPATGAADLAGR